MESSSSTNRRIAKNTLMLYFRMILIITVSLFTMRVVLAKLGAEDYGIYNAVGGFVALFSILSGSMVVAIGRFITIEIGRKALDKAIEVFSSSVLILMAVSVLVGLAGESIGVWFLNAKMVIPDGRMAAANWVLHLSILTFVVKLMYVPFHAVIIAHERMSVFAFISILEAMLLFTIALLVDAMPFDRLVAYACLMVLSALFILLVYACYCRWHFEEVRCRLASNRKLLCEMAAFTGWAFVGNGSVVLKDQGSNVLLNLFGGPAVNAARGIAMQVNTAIYGFVSNFMMAVNPQITKSYAQGDLPIMHKLIIRSSKFGFFILLVMLLPLCANIDYVLGLWLVEVPAHTANFIVLVLLYSLLECVVSPLATGVVAQGEIKSYNLVLASLYVVNFAASYVCLKMGMAVEVVFVLNIFFKACVLVALLVHSRAKYNFPVLAFFRQCLVPAAAVFSVSSFFAFLLSDRELTGFWDFAWQTFAIVLFTACVSLGIGMTRKEMNFLRELLKKKLTR